MRDDLQRLLDIVEAIENIQRYVSKEPASFTSNELIQVWVIHHIQIIGEAASGVSHSIRSRYSDIPWADIIAMRNVLVHQYFGIDREELWNTVEKDLPSLKSRVRAIIADLQQ